MVALCAEIAVSRGFDLALERCNLPGQRFDFLAPFFVLSLKRRKTALHFGKLRVEVSHLRFKSVHFGGYLFGSVGVDSFQCPRVCQVLV